MPITTPSGVVHAKHLTEEGGRPEFGGEGGIGYSTRKMMFEIVIGKRQCV